MESKLVTIAELCKVLGGDDHLPLTKMSITRFVDEGMPKAQRGRYDLLPCVTWYFGRLRTAVKRKQSESADGEILSLDKEQTRLTKAKADNEEMTAGERRGRLIPLDVYEEQMSKLVNMVKIQFLNLPARVAPKLDGLSIPVAKALLTASVKSILGELARNGHSPKPAIPETEARRSSKRSRLRSSDKPKHQKAR